MKTVILLSLLSVSSAALAANKTLTYDCGMEMGHAVTLDVTPVKGKAYGYKGTFKAPGKDKTTGMHIPSKTTELVGSTEVIDGKHLFHLHDPQDPNFQVAAIIANPGEYAPVEELILTGGPFADGKTRYCKVK